MTVGAPGRTAGAGVHSSATGMAANDPHQRSDRPAPGAAECLDAAALDERLEEEIGRAERHDTPLSCLLVMVENIDELARDHGVELREQTLEYVASALQGELRRFDRVGRSSPRDLLLVLPGANGPRAEIVARRALERLGTIKVEAGGTRRPLEISLGLATWRKDVGAKALLEQARATLRSINGDRAHSTHASVQGAAPPAHETPASSGGQAPASAPSAL
jgi:diguanylate cyclase (GGDEF)-like protein